MAEIYAGKGGGSDWATSALLVNTITSWTYYNNKRCANTLVYHGAQLVLAHNCSIVPGSWALTQILTNSHIFASSARMTIIFTYMETRASPLSYYTHSILLCCPSLVSAGLCVALLMRALTNFTVSSSHQLPRHTATPSRRRESGFFLSLATM